MTGWEEFGMDNQVGEDIEIKHDGISIVVM